MTKNTAKIKEGIRALANSTNEIISGTVVPGSINTIEYSMSVLSSDDGDPVEGVMLNSVIESGNGMILFPADGSNVIIGSIDGPGEWTLLKANEIHNACAIVLDVNLPDTDGHTVCRELKADVETAGVPVLMLTVRDNDADVLAGLEAGADDYVAKDSAPEIVLARVRRLIQFRRLAAVAVLNEQLVQVGRLLAGIVHEIRGPLAVIRGSAELMRLQAAPNDPSLQWVEPILRSAKLLQVRLEHLMATVRSGSSILEIADLDPIVNEATELFTRGTDPRGAKVIMPPTNFWWALEMRIEDPNGHVLRFGSESRPDRPLCDPKVDMKP